VSGSWFGKPGSYLGLEVDVRVQRCGGGAAPAAAPPLPMAPAAQSQALGAA
jgi:hypothetical protein